MRVGVVIPWYEHDHVDVRRSQALSFVVDWWRSAHPLWQVSVGAMRENEGPWCKSLAVHRGATALRTCDVVVVSDADVICDGVDVAVEEIVSLRASWCVPHRLVYRMTSDATRMLVDAGRYPRLVRSGTVSPDFTEIYTGKIGGGLVVLPPKLLADVPIDPRFVGWGQEDLSWGHALTMLAGHPWHGTAPLLHLWHPPQHRVSRGVGSLEGLSLWQQYQHAPTIAAMSDIVEQARTVLADRSDVRLPMVTDTA